LNLRFIILQMLRELKEDKKFFLVRCADWEYVAFTHDNQDAAAIALEEANSIYKRDMKVSPTIGVMDLSSSYSDLELNDNIAFFYTPNVLANAGMHSLAKKFSKIIKLMKEDDSKD